MRLEEKVEQTRIKTERALELAGEGMNQREIAEAIGMTQKGVSLMLKRAGVSAKEHGTLQRKVAMAAQAVKKSRAPGAGRPPAGGDGVQVRNLPTLMLRLTPTTLAGLKAHSAVTGIPAWRLVDAAVSKSLGQLKGEIAEDVRRLSKRELARIKAANPLAG